MRDQTPGERRLAHLADTSPDRLHMLGTKIRMMREERLQLADRLRGDASGHDLMQPDEGVGDSLEPGHACLDAEAEATRFDEVGDAGKRGEVLVGPVGFDAHPQISDFRRTRATAVSAVQSAMPLQRISKRRIERHGRAGRGTVIPLDRTKPRRLCEF